MSDDQTPRLGLPFLAAGQMQKHVTLNESLTRLDALVQTAVASRSVSAQPADPADGVLYILPVAATGAAWAGRAEGALMRAEAGGWRAVEVSEGLIALVLDADEIVVRHGTTWRALGSRLGMVQGLSRLGIGTTADASNPFAARLNTALWTALEAGAGGDGDLRLTLNKESATDVLSLLFQSGYGGRAELGLIGDDDLKLKISPDGATWREAFSVDRTTGRTSFALGAGRRELTAFTSDGAYVVPVWAQTIDAVVVGGGGGGGAGAFAASGARHGGGGGGAGGVGRAGWPAHELTAGLDVLVGAGGTGGAAGTGSVGLQSSISLGVTALLVGAGGRGGGLGDALAGTGGVGGGGSAGSNGGGSSSVATDASGGQSMARPDAPGGGGLDVGGVARSGGVGGDGGALAVKAIGGSAGVGWSGGGGWGAPMPGLHWSGAGHSGASGGASGGGGGGGGAGVLAGGAGGSGASGVVWLIAIG
ncbi:DUF2793 domain-containing protein [Brevundimonas sp.]|uniref:DUF2793 domain-containing protein n=1 Tax=Brevundimonas sp. TaxID=1871086 RepID=UPI003567FD31